MTATDAIYGGIFTCNFQQRAAALRVIPISAPAKHGLAARPQNDRKVDIK
jgi:hypothetical protein